MYSAALIALIGLLLYLFVNPAVHPKIVRVGEIMFLAGMIAVCLQAPSWMSEGRPVTFTLPRL